MARPTGTWKHTERAVAKAMGGRRMGPGGDRADVRSDWLTVEVKHRRRLPGWLVAAVDQAHVYATENTLPVAVIHQAGDPLADALVVMHLGDFRAWFGDVSGADAG